MITAHVINDNSSYDVINDNSSYDVINDNSSCDVINDNISCDVINMITAQVLAKPDVRSLRAATGDQPEDQKPSPYSDRSVSHSTVYTGTGAKGIRTFTPPFHSHLSTLSPLGE